MVFDKVINHLLFSFLFTKISCYLSLIASLTQPLGYLSSYGIVSVVYRKIKGSQPPTLTTFLPKLKSKLETPLAMLVNMSCHSSPILVRQLEIKAETPSICSRRHILQIKQKEEENFVPRPEVDARCPTDQVASCSSYDLGVKIMWLMGV